VLIVLAAVVLLFLLGGILAARRRRQRFGPVWERHIVEADRALGEARAADKGWDRGRLEAAARAAIADQRPDFAYDRLELVLVDDRPGTTEDRAHLMAVGADGEARVVLARREGDWVAERVG
jgi:hypothetical protein